MAINGGEATRARPARWRRLRVSTPGLLVLVAIAAVVFEVYRRRVLVPSRADRPTLAAVYRRTAPVADGALGANEYGAGTRITWAEGNTLAAFQNELYSPDGSTVRHNPWK